MLFKKRDIMDRSKIGKRIKELRLSLGLTQQELTNGYMTRNMLSLIESGAALPSLESAEYIAKRLNVSLAFLLSDNAEKPKQIRETSISLIRDSFAQRDYEHCIEALESLEEHDFETAYIFAYSALYRGKELTENGSFAEAESLLRAALQKCKETVYDTAYVEAVAPLYLAIVSNYQSPILELDTDAYERIHLTSYEFELYKYVTSDLDFEFSTPILKLHAEAKSLIRKYRFAEAIELLRRIEEMKTASYNAFVFFGVYTDLENCYKQLGDFENAYRYSSKRINLINVFGS